MKGAHSSVYGPRWPPEPLLWTEFMYPIARINNASLIRDSPPPRPLEGGGLLGQGGARRNGPPCQPGPPQIIIGTNVFIGKNLFGEFIKDAPPYIFPPAAGDRGDRVTDMLLSSKMQR